MNDAIQRLSFLFALGIIAFVEVMEERKHYVLSKQLLRSGTSIGANVMEAQHAESRADFVHKCKIAAKEAEETDYWLRLCTAAPNYPNPPNDLVEQLLSIRRLLSKIITTAKANS